MTISDFKKDTSLTSIPENSSNLTNLDLEPVIAYGRLRALFGEPNYETQNFEDAYSYILFVESESSEKIYLEVYEGSSGPAIGGLNNAESLQAAETLFLRQRQRHRNSVSSLSVHPRFVSRCRSRNSSRQGIRE